MIIVITPNPHTNIVPTNIARLKLSGDFPMNLEIPPLQIKIVLESNPLKPTMLVGGLGVSRSQPQASACTAGSQKQPYYTFTIHYIYSSIQ